jgi:hypothetical protein
MRLTLTTGGTATEAFGLTDQVVWSGAKNKAVRSVQFGVVTSTTDPNLPAVDCPLGAQVELYDDEGAQLFTGIVVCRSATTGEGIVTVTAYDKGLYLVNNDGTFRWSGVTAEAATRQLCQQYGIPVGTLAATGVSLSRKFAGVSLWQIVTTLYSKAAEQTGKRYMTRMDGGSLRVLERTVSATSLVIRPKSNLRSATTQESIVEMRNSVAIYDSTGALVQTLEDSAARSLYGLMQEHLTQRDGEDATAEARKVLEDQGVEQTVTVECSGDVRLITGETVVVRDTESNLNGIFWVDGDTHTWSKGDYVCRLELNCKNVMYTASAGGDLT